MFWYLHIIRVNFYVSLNPRLFIRIVVKFTIHAKCWSPLCVFFPQCDVLCWWRSRFFTVTLRPCSIESTSIVRYVTWCPGTKWMWKKRKTRAAVSFICKKAESLPRHILGPAWNAVNLKGDSGWYMPFLSQRSGLNSRASAPQINFIRPIEYGTYPRTHPFLTTVPSGNTSSAIACLQGHCWK